MRSPVAAKLPKQAHRYDESQQPCRCIASRASRLVRLRADRRLAGRRRRRLVLRRALRIRDQRAASATASSTLGRRTRARSLARTRPTLVLFLHPKCPCSRASLNELSDCSRDMQPADRPRPSSGRRRHGSAAAVDEAWWNTDTIAQSRQLADAQRVYRPRRPRSRAIRRDDQRLGDVFRRAGTLAATPAESRSPAATKAAAPAAIVWPALLRGEPARCERNCPCSAAGSACPDRCRARNRGHNSHRQSRDRIIHLKQISRSPHATDSRGKSPGYESPWSLQHIPTNWPSRRRSRKRSASTRTPSRATSTGCLPG